MERQEVASNLKWKVEDIFPSDEAWEKEFQEIATKYGNYDFSVFKGKLGDKQTLLEFFKLNDGISRKIEKLYVYAHMSSDQDVRISKYNSYMAKMRAFAAKMSASLAFFEPELTALDESVLNGYIADPDFAAAGTQTASGQQYNHRSACRQYSGCNQFYSQSYHQYIQRPHPQPLGTAYSLPALFQSVCGTVSDIGRLGRSDRRMAA